ncbi:MAG: DUF6132 family protein [bacterium]
MEKPCEVNIKPKTVKEYLLSSNFWKPALGVIIGGGLGYLYYSFIGCSSGKCAITSSPYMSIMYGSFIGFLLVKSPCKNC